MLLTFCIMNYPSYQSFYDRPHEFYRSAYDTILSDHDMEKSPLDRVFRSADSQDDFTDVFREFCAISYVERKFQFNKMTFEAIFKKLKSTKQVANPRIMNKTNFLHDACATACMMYEAKSDILYIDPGFQQFLFAEYNYFAEPDEVEAMGRKLWTVPESEFNGGIAFEMLYELSDEKVEVCLDLPYLDMIFKDKVEEESFNAFLVHGFREIKSALIDRAVIEECEQKSGIIGKYAIASKSEPKSVILSMMLDYAKMTDEEAEEAREGLVQEKGFFILPSELFCNVRARASLDENLNETLERVFRHIEESAQGSQSENSFAGLFDDFDVNSNKLGSTVAKRNERLVKLLDGIAAMNLGSVKDHDIDAFGDAYEYLMTMYASNAGKSGGEFFTPADVSVLLTRLGTVGKTTINKVYDPACGSGSLLLKAEKLLGKEAVMNGFFGQEINITTYNLCRINMFLHDIDFDKFDIECEDTLTNPQHWDDEPFELIVSNPPYSIKWSGDDNPLLINDPRFAPAGVLAPKSKADLAFIMHSLSWLAPNGTAAIVCFPGIMYRGGAEKKIRQYLVDNNYIDCIIQLPSNLFFGTSISTCIMVLKKGKVDDKILFIDASKEFVKVTNNNRLTQENIQHIMDTYVQRTEIVHYAHVASHKEVVNNNYNLAVSTYVEEEDTREEIDIEDLENRIQDIVQQEDELRRDIESIIREIEGGTE